MSRAATLALCTATIALAACGEEQEPQPPPPPPPPKETREPLPERPREWKRYVNRPGGYAVLRPRGWKASREGATSLIRSFDRLVAISIAPDRSEAGFELSVDDYATRAAEALRGFTRPPQLRAPGPFAHRYEGAEVAGRATARDGIAQKLAVIVLRRDRQATFTVVLAANAKRAARKSARVARRVVRTLRSRPPSAGGRPRSGGRQAPNERDRAGGKGDRPAG